MKEVRRDLIFGSLEAVKLRRFCNDCSSDGLSIGASNVETTYHLSPTRPPSNRSH